MSRPDLCFETSSCRKSLSRRCRFSIASSTVKRGRTPRNSATSPRQGFRSTMTVGRFDSRASSTAQFTATVVVPAPPLAPRNTCVTHGCLLPAEVASRRAARPAHRAVERLLHRARGLGLRRRRPGEELVGAGAHRLQDQVGLGGRGNREDGHAVVAGAQPLDGRHPRRRVGADVDDEDVGRGVLDRPSTMPTGTPPARSSRATWRLNSSSWLTIDAASCAMEPCFFRLAERFSGAARTTRSVAPVALVASGPASAFSTCD